MQIPSFLEGVGFGVWGVRVWALGFGVQGLSPYHKTAWGRSRDFGSRLSIVLPATAVEVGKPGRVRALGLGLGP